MHAPLLSFGAEPALSLLDRSSHFPEGSGQRSAPSTDAASRPTGQIEAAS